MISDIFNDIEFLALSIQEAVSFVNRLEDRRRALFDSFTERLQHLADLETPTFVDRHILSSDGAYAAFMAALKAREVAEDARKATLASDLERQAAALAASSSAAEPEVLPVAVEKLFDD